MTYDWVRILGTVWFKHLDLINRVNVEQEVEALKDATRGNWYLCRTYLPIAPTTRRTTAPRSEVPSAKVAGNCGFIVWKDHSTVTFYSDDLTGTP